jgi:5-methylcytosine-specific restriction endonuclease McrA
MEEEMPYKNIEDRRAYDHFRYHNNPKRKAATLAYQKAHAEQNRLRTAKWREENPNYQRERYRANPEYMKSKVNKRRTEKTKAGGSYSVEEFLTLCELREYKCLCCGKVRILTADHVVPVSKGGTSNIENIQPLCRPCNSKKRAKDTDYRSKKWKTQATMRLKLLQKQ